MRLVHWSTLTLAAGSMLALGCSQSENPLRPDSYSATRTMSRSYGFTEQLGRNSLKDPDARQIVVAWASDEDPSTPQQPFPILYLFHGYGGDASEFDRYGLQTLLDDMYAKGEIGRMMVVTVDASDRFGGSFYRNSGTTGDYADVIAELMRLSETPVGSQWRFYTQGGRNARAISGHGMGGYGAMRYAMDHPDLFASVSSMSGPLSLGNLDQKTGVWDEDDGLVTQVFAENGITAPDPDTYAKIFAGAERPRTRLYLAMAAAFSPYPLRRFDSVGHYIYDIIIGGYRKKDTLYPYDFFTAIPRGPLTIKFDGADTSGAGVDMLFDSNGVLSPESWARWRDSADVRSVFPRLRQANPAFFSALFNTQDTNVYIDVGDQDEYGYLAQNREFHETLNEAGVKHRYTEYTGFAGVPAGHSQLVAARLREVIKFHSDLFDKYGGRPPAPPH
ncbi:MAG: alpha/beta hydrolase-fold protein [Candidatus Zixiibacteriota bacterium]